MTLINSTRIINHRYHKFIILLATFTFGFYFLWHWKVQTLQEVYIKIPSSKPYVNTEGCVIPYYDPFDESVMRFYTQPMHMICTNQTPLTYQDGLLLKLDEQSVSYCTSQAVIRTENDDDNFTFSNAQKFTKSFKVTSEFVRVMCFNSTDSHVYSNVHAFIPRNLTREKEQGRLLAKHKREHKPADTLNVLMIGVDSISRLNQIRLMPKTRDYLMHDLSAVDYQGYTKVADNTLVNVVPMLTGNFYDVESAKRKIRYGGPYDKYHLIWKNFSSNGYTTVMAEDAPAMGEFNYHKLGFAKPPGHHYLRPFSLALEKENGVFFGGYHSCVWNRSETQVVLDYVHDFMKTYRNVPFFAWTFISRLTHGKVQDAAYADDIYLQYLKTIHKEGLLDNTILFFLSDHGIRYGRILRTDIGKLELRLPFMNIVFPPWFRQKYPEMYQNVVRNANKLTSPFDIYETLKDILYFTGKPRQFVKTKQGGISLFDPIPETRTCDQAFISPHWCVCELEEIKLDNDLLRNNIFRFILGQINLTMKKYPMCVKRKLENVLNMKRYRRLGSKNCIITLIKVAFTLTPDDAEFEATVQHNSTKASFRLAGTINRVNKYGHTADCLKIGNLKKFCYCSNNLNSKTSPQKSSKLLKKRAFKPRRSTSKLPNHTPVKQNKKFTPPKKSKHKTTSKPHRPKLAFLSMN